MKAFITSSMFSLLKRNNKLCSRISINLDYVYNFSGSNVLTSQWKLQMRSTPLVLLLINIDQNLVKIGKFISHEI